MDISTFRREVLGVSQETFAQLVGLTSKSRISDIERSNTCPPRIALEIERLSEGRVRAESICPAVALVRSNALTESHPPRVPQPHSPKRRADTRQGVE